ncbi:MAG TPA: M35 family metallopeptidase [Terrimicrobium sp.]
MKDTGSFFSAKGPEEEPQAKEPAEQETPAAKESEEEPVKSKASEEEEPVKAKLKGDEGKPIAAKCSCGCGGSGTCGKSAPSAEDREQSKAPANTTSAHQPAAAGAAHADCSPAQESAAASAASQAGSLARRAQQAAGVASLGDDPAPTAMGHYERWFGRIDGHRAQLVRDTFAAIVSSIDGSINFRCDSGKNVYAYVKSCGSKEIYLGRLFWTRAASTGIDSRPGVILHEIAHDVSRVIGDHSYGVAGAEDLAAKNPDRAVRSADNYEYFAESL